MKIKILKEKKATEYTFIHDGLSLEKSIEKDSDFQKERTELDFRLRYDTRLNKVRHKSKITGGHNMQGHSPVYE